MLILENISIASILIPIIVGLIFYRKLTANFKGLFLLLFIGLFVEAFGITIKPLLKGTEYLYLSNVYWYTIEFGLIVIFYNRRFKPANLWKYASLWLIAYYVAAIRSDAVAVFNPNLRLMMSIPLVLLSTWGLYQSVKNKDLAVGLVSFGFLLYFSTTIPVFIYYSDLNRSIWVAHSVSNILMNALIGVGLIYGRSARVFKGNDAALGRISLLDRRSNISGY